MKIIILECDAEELRANRAVLESITEAISGFTRSLCGVDISPETMAEAMAKQAVEASEEDPDE